MRKISPLSPAALTLVMLAAAIPCPAQSSYDLLFRGGRVVDGTGAPWFAADVAVRDGRIAAIGRLEGARATRVVDATGLVIAPGFIDLLGQSEYNVLVDGRAASKITQGITTEVTGEGASIAPISERMFAEGQDAYARYGYTPDFRTLDGYFKAFERRGASINLGSLVGSGGVRDFVIGKDNRRATAEELDEMCALVDTAMREGALGALLVAPVRARHLQLDRGDRGDGEGRRPLRGCLLHAPALGVRPHRRLARRGVPHRLRSGHPLEVWHLKTAYRPNFGRMPEILAKIESARARGIDVAANVYPWNRASNGLDACLPPWVREGGREALLKRLADPATRERVKADMAQESGEWENQWLGAGGGEGVMVAEVLSPKLKLHEGRTVASIAAAERKDPRDVVIDIVLADRANASCILSIMDEQDVRTALAHPLVSFDCDSQAKAKDGPFAGETSHPRGWGSASRILGYYVREQKLLRLEEAVRKMTSLAAQAAGIPDRGLVKLGLRADLTLFDPQTVAARATFEDPNQYSAGIPYVAVNGVLVVDAGRITDARPGHALRGPGYAGAR